jgi:hypothetical protein
MTKIRMNTELRNKLFNKIKNVFENEDTQEKRHFFKQEKKLIVNMVLRQHLQKKLLQGHIHQKMLQL